MKSILQLIFAGILGGAVAFAGFQFMDQDTVIYETATPQPQRTSNQATTTHRGDTAGDFVYAAERTTPAVVHISAQNKAYHAVKEEGRYNPYFDDFWGLRRHNDRPKAGTGSGVILSRDGYIVTNNHVVGFADYIKVSTADGKEYTAKKIGTDPSTDLAVIKIEADNLPHLEFMDSDQLKIGQWALAVGNPFDLNSTVTVGIISAMGRDLDIIKGQKTIEEFIQTDAVVNPGNSGGALVDDRGRLIGINTAISSPTGVYAGYSFAIPSNLVRRVVDEIMSTGGDIQRAMLGIHISDVETLRRENVDLDIDIDNGVMVIGFPKDRYGRRLFSSAEAAGIEVGDIIVNANNQPVSSFQDLSEAIKFIKVGETVDLIVRRNGKNKKIPVKLRRGI